MERFNSLLKHAELSALQQRTQATQAAQKIWEAIAPAEVTKFSHASSIKISNSPCSPTTAWSRQNQAFNT